VNLDFNDNIGKMHDAAPLPGKKARQILFSQKSTGRTKDVPTATVPA
jgi:hypothetical protein